MFGSQASESVVERFQAAPDAPQPDRVFDDLLEAVQFVCTVAHR